MIGFEGYLLGIFVLFCLILAVSPKKLAVLTGRFSRYCYAITLKKSQFLGEYS